MESVITALTASGVSKENIAFVKNCMLDARVVGHTDEFKRLFGVPSGAPESTLIQWVNDNSDIVQRLHDTVKFTHNSNATHCASQNGYTELVMIFINSYNVSVDTLNDNKCTPLHMTSLSGRTETVKALLNAGANIEVITTESQTPLHLAVYNGNAETVKTLLDAGANSILLIKNVTMLHIASLRGHTDTVKVLLNAGADIDAVDNDGHPSLYYASRECHTETVKVLLDAGADSKHLSINSKYNVYLAYARSVNDRKFITVTHNGTTVKIDPRTVFVNGQTSKLTIESLMELINSSTVV